MPGPESFQGPMRTAGKVEEALEVYDARIIPVYTQGPTNPEIFPESELASDLDDLEEKLMIPGLINGYDDKMCLVWQLRDEGNHGLAQYIIDAYNLPDDFAPLNWKDK